jgi:peptidyl-tRNA hydrolase
MGVIRQIIVVNLEVPFPIGRITAHACHSSVARLLDSGSWDGKKFIIDTTGNYELEYWMKDSFTKAVCKCWGKDALLAIKDKAETLGIPVSVIEEEDYFTALGIGPSSADKMDSFKDLPLL